MRFLIKAIVFKTWEPDAEYGTEKLDKLSFWHAHLFFKGFKEFWEYVVYLIPRYHITTKNLDFLKWSFKTISIFQGG